MILTVGHQSVFSIFCLGLRVSMIQFHVHSGRTLRPQPELPLHRWEEYTLFLCQLHLQAIHA